MHKKKHVKSCIICTWYTWYTWCTWYIGDSYISYISYIYRTVYVCIIYTKFYFDLFLTFRAICTQSKKWYILQIQRWFGTVIYDLKRNIAPTKADSPGFVSTLLNVNLGQVLSDGSPQKPMVFLHLSCHDSTSQKKVTKTAHCTSVYAL